MGWWGNLPELKIHWYIVRISRLIIPETSICLKSRLVSLCHVHGLSIGRKCPFLLQECWHFLPSPAHCSRPTPSYVNIATAHARRPLSGPLRQLVVCSPENNPSSSASSMFFSWPSLSGFTHLHL
jgi:hypothetical protein